MHDRWLSEFKFGSYVIACAFMNVFSGSFGFSLRKLSRLQMEPPHTVHPTGSHGNFLRFQRIRYVTALSDCVSFFHITCFHFILLQVIISNF